MYKTILLPLDPEQENSWRNALPRALELARFYNANLYITTVLPEDQVHPWQDKPGEVSSDLEARLEAFVRDHVPPELPIYWFIVSGVHSVHRGIRQAACEVDADLIVLASHNPRITDVLLGSSASQVALHSDRSVLIVREYESPVGEGEG